jgi:uncharacterized protein YjbJ (UPF0337 family)
MQPLSLNVSFFEQTAQARAVKLRKDQRYAGPAPRQEAVRTSAVRFLVHGIGSSRRKKMNPSTKDEIKGNIHAVKGKVKETAGQVTNNPDLEAGGKAERTAGKIEKKVGQIEKVLGK